MPGASILNDRMSIRAAIDTQLSDRDFATKATQTLCKLIMIHKQTPSIYSFAMGQWTIL